jgi:surfeit locus 1 family protein
MVFRPLPLLSLFTALALAALIALGTWQLDRREQKHALLASIEARAKTPAAPVEILFVTGEHYPAYRPATAVGTFDHSREVYVYAPRADGGPTRQGFRVLTPFALSSGNTILVDRGWIGEMARDPTTRAKGQVEGELELEGRLLPSTPPGTFTPPADLKTRTFYVRDAEAIAQAVGVRLHRRLIFEATTHNEGGPEPKPTELTLPDNHLSYAITWFSLSVVLLIIYLRYHHLRGRLRFGR